MNKSGEGAAAASQQIACAKPWGSIRDTNKLGVMTHICSHTSQQVETGESEIQGHPRLQIKFEARPGSENQNTTTKHFKARYTSSCLYSWHVGGWGRRTEFEVSLGYMARPYLKNDDDVMLCCGISMHACIWCALIILPPLLSHSPLLKTHLF